MNIKIGEEYIITSDAYNVIINERYEKKTKEGESKVYDFKPVGFYPSLEKACNALLDRYLLLSNSKDIASIKVAIRGAKEEILEAIRNE